MISLDAMKSPRGPNEDARNEMDRLFDIAKTETLDDVMHRVPRYAITFDDN